MSLPPARLRAVRGLALAATVLLTVPGCLAAEPERAAGEPGAVPPSAGRRAPDRTPALTAAQARDALITVNDLGVPWGPTEGAATWRDGLLKAVTDMPECQQLMNALYTEDLFGEAPGTTHAVTALDDVDGGSQLRYQVGTHGPASVNRTLAWLHGLPQTCGRFTAETQSAGPQDIEVSEIELPQVGDARQGLRITLTGETATEDEEASALSLEVAAVRVGEDAIVVTNGALGEVSEDTTDQALELGTRRLTQVREQGRARA
ncbi:hypothetical protein ACWEKM_24945 [Streptomyces sp. NPDC004752]